MPTLNDLKDQDGVIHLSALYEAVIPINGAGRIPLEHLDRMRQDLAGNELALQFLSRFLKFARKRVEATKEGTRNYDHAVAEVAYGRCTFLFMDMSDVARHFRRMGEIPDWRLS